MDDNPVADFDGSETEAILDDIASSSYKHKWYKPVIWVSAIVLGLFGLYVGAQWYFAGRIASGTTVAGIDIGGKTTKEATETLNKKLLPLSKETVELKAGEQRATFNPQNAGFSVNVERTVNSLTSFSWNPKKLIEHFSGETAVSPEIDVNQEKADAVFAELQTTLNTDPISAGLSFADGQVLTTPASQGVMTKAKDLQESVAEQWLVKSQPLEVPFESQTPAVTDADVADLLPQARQVIAAPVTVIVQDKLVTIGSADIAANASYVLADSGKLELQINDQAIFDQTIAGLGDLIQAPRDASIQLADGTLQTVGAQIGTTIDATALKDGFRTAILGELREVRLDLVEVQPEITDDKVSQLGITEVVGEFATTLTADAQRTQNIVIGAGKMNGKVIKPGETFDLLETIGPISEANGYKDSGIIQDGVYTKGLGGGLSQLATTSYNAGFFGGMIDVEHQPHSYYISRYPEGREATIYEGSINMRWRNDSPYAVLIQSWVADNQIHVALWSTKYYNVETTTSARSNITAPVTETRSGANCVAQKAGGPGFKVSVWRKVSVIATGEVVVDETNTWKYKAENGITCSS